MAGGQERLLRRRIRSVQSIRKTTRAMELIASSRIVRAQQRIVAARPYAQALDRTASDLAASLSSQSHPLIGEPASDARTVLVVIAGDRGLSGAYNANVVRQAESLARQASVAGLIAIGRRAQSYLRFRGHSVDQLYGGMTDRPEYAQAQEVAQFALELFADKQAGVLEVVSTRWRSLGLQQVRRLRVLPISAEGGTAFDYETEPEAQQLVDALVPQLVESAIFLALLEAAASEHAARQRAMKAATDNADDLVTNLRRLMNRVRQDSITTEIMDIVGGAEALRHAAGGALPPLPDDQAA